jgi:peptide chain release factor 1
VAGDARKLRELSRERAGLEPTIEALADHGKLARLIADDEQAVASGDPELAELAQAELPDLRDRIAKLEDKLKALLLPRDPDDDRNVIVEVRSGTGGDEASLFAGDLYRMYTKHAERRGWRLEVLNTSPGAAGGFKEIVFSLSGKGVYREMKFESGVHRVQRVPDTEASGRIHTSAATVAVLPEAEDVEVEVREADLRVDVYRAGGPGGQGVNTTDSAVRITHIPTNTVVSCQNERSQHANRDTAMKMLRAKLYELEVQKRNAAAQALEDTKSDIGWGHQIRSYVLDQSRIKDLRTGVERSDCDKVLDGDLDEYLEASLKQGL